MLLRSVGGNWIVWERGMNNLHMRTQLCATPTQTCMCDRLQQKAGFPEATHTQLTFSILSCELQITTA